MKWTISTAIDSIIANSFLSRMHISMGKSIIIIDKERPIRERSSQEKVGCKRVHLTRICYHDVLLQNIPSIRVV